MPTTDLIIETKPLCDLMPAPYNPRQISPEALAGLRGSVERFGLVEPVVWNRRTGNVVGGHQRLKVLQAMGESETQVIVVDLPEAEEKALNVALNSPSIAGEFTPEIHALLAEIEASLPELSSLLRFDDLADQMKHLLSDLEPEEGLVDADDVPEPPAEPITQPGDLWLLGGHRLICGDSTDAAVLARLMNGQRAAIYATDPPYGVGYDGTAHPVGLAARAQGRDSESVNKDWADQYADHNAWDHFPDRAAFETFLEAAFAAALPHLADNAAWYTWHASATAPSFLAAWQAVGVRYHQTIVWVKPTAVLGFSMWNWRYEPCLMGWKPGHKPDVLAVPGEFTNVWEADWEGKARCTDSQHPTQKPTRLFELPLQKHTRPGQICLESFSGSGSQIIAAERLGRRCFAVERLPQFVDVAVRRWERFTGLTAVRAAAEVA